MKKLSCIALALLLMLAVTSCGSPTPSSANDPKVTLVYAEVNPADSLMGKTATVFKEKVEELTNGSVTIDIQFSGVLGAEGDVLDTMLGGGGTIDLTRISVFSLNSYGTKKQPLLSIPFTFESREHFWNMALSDFGDELLSEPAELGLGITGLFFVEEGFRHFFFAKEVKDINDLAGTKIRVSTDPIMTGMVAGLKASATVVSFGELYTSLSSGVVDGAEQPIANYQSNAFYEVAPYMILDGHTLGCGEVIMLESSLEKLTDNQKNAIREASKVASEFNGGLSEENEQKCIDEMLAKGVTFVQVDDLSPWQAATADVTAEFSKGMEAEYAKIASYK